MIKHLPDKWEKGELAGWPNGSCLDRLEKAMDVLHQVQLRQNQIIEYIKEKEHEAIRKSKTA